MNTSQTECLQPGDGNEPTTPANLTTADKSPRFFALDSLRAIMMLLGIYLHTVVGYSREGGWPYKDPHPTAIYDFTLGLIHAFRMPLFYVMAGFFAALLYYRRGLRGFLWNRTKRILVPFVVGWTLLFPIVAAMGTYARALDQPKPWAKVHQVMSIGEFLKHLHPLHLWFLEYLILLLALGAASVLLVTRFVPEGFRAAFNGVFRAILKSPLKPLLLAAPMFGALCLSRHGFLDDPPGFIPVFHILLPYILSFSFGWLLYRNVDLLTEMQRFARAQLAAMAGVVALIVAIGGWMSRHPDLAKFALAAGVSLVMWLMICGLTGVFLRYLDRPMPRMRYMADSSYWLYIVHMPALMVFQILLRPVPWPAALKVWIVLLLAIPVMLLSYHYWVRPTFVGQILNGKKHPRVQSGTAGFSGETMPRECKNPARPLSLSQTRGLQES